MLIVAALTLWMIIFSIAMVVQTTQAVSRKMKAQMAADTAALAGATTLANSLSTIAWVNDSRALIHYMKVRYGADLVAAGTLAMLKTRLPLLENDVVGPSIRDNVAPGNWPRLGVPNFTERFFETFETYTEARQAPWETDNPTYWSEPGRQRQVKGQNLEEELARFQHALASVTKVLVEKEIYDKAAENGSELTAYFPSFEFMPDPGGERYLDIQAIDTMRGEGEDSLHVNGWRMWNDELEIRATSIGEDSWEIFYRDANREINVRIVQDSPPGWLHIVYDAVLPGGNEHQEVWVNQEDNIIITADERIHVETLPDGGTQVTRTTDEGTTTFRYKVIDGVAMVWDESVGDYVDVRRPGPEGEPVDSVEINGTQVRVDAFNRVDFDSVSVWTNRISVGPFTISYMRPVRIVSHLYGFRIVAENDEARVNGLSTRTADCRWRSTWAGGSNDTGQDRSRHRMCEIETDFEWRYEWSRDPGYLTYEMAQVDDDLEDRYSELQGRFLATGREVDREAWEGTLELRTGTPTTNEEGEALYEQRRQCWHPLDRENGRGDGVYTIDDVPYVCNVCTRNDDGSPIVEDGGTVSVARLEGLLSGSGILPLDYYDGKTFQDADDARTIVPMLEALHQFPDILNSVRRLPSTALDLPPLVLHESYFKYGITVATWISSDSSPGFEGSSRAIAPNADFSEGSDGIFAFAAARAGFRHPETGELILSISAENGEREGWIDSRDNLYLADWEASLVPLTSQIESFDIDADEDADSGLTYLLRRFNTTAWRSDYFGRNRRHRIRIEGFDLNHLSLYDLVQH